MSEKQSPDDSHRDGPAAGGESLVASALAQLREDARLYNEAVGSYNTHLDNHRERCDLESIPYREPVTAHEAYEGARTGDRAALRRLLDDLLAEVTDDSVLRRHPRTYPIHREAVAHLSTARDQLVTTIEEALVHINDEHGLGPHDTCE